MPNSPLSPHDVFNKLFAWVQEHPDDRNPFGPNAITNVVAIKGYARFDPVTGEYWIIDGKLLNTQENSLIGLVLYIDINTESLSQPGMEISLSSSGTGVHLAVAGHHVSFISASGTLDNGMLFGRDGNRAFELTYRIAREMHFSVVGS